MACLALLASFAFAVVGAVRDDVELRSMGVEEGVAGPRHHRNATKANLNVLQYNLCWECMSAWDDGSGKYASKHCTPGQIVDAVPASSATLGKYRWEGLGASLDAAIRLPNRSRNEDQHRIIFEGKALARYATSCTYNMMRKLLAWHSANPFDFVSMSELCSPGEDGQFVTGFQPQGKANALEYGVRQCSPLIFDIMDQVIFRDLEPAVHAVPTIFGPVTQLTWYPKRLGAPHIIKTDMAVGRPITALVWASKQLMFINMHAIHFRKNLIGALNCNEFPDMCKYVKDVGHLDKPNIEKGQFIAAFSLSKLSTADLSALFGGFVTSRIAKHLPEGLCSDRSACTLSADWRIIVGGDFNDETSELFDVTLFGRRVYLDSDKRKRTCCSDRDEYWLSTYANLAPPFTGYTGGLSSSYTHTQANWQYLLEQCKYEGECTEAKQECKDLFNAEAPNAIITAVGAGAPRPPESGLGPSRYPFPSDLILDSAPVVSFSFPDGYMQTVEEAYSDHDPVVAVLQPLK